MAKENSPAGVKHAGGAEAVARRGAGQPEQAEHQRHFHGENGERRAGEKAEMGRDQVTIDRHADRHEEQAHQQAAKRLDIGLELVAEVRFGQKHPGKEGAERHGHADRLHQHGRAEHDEQRRGGERFTRPGAGQQAKQRIKRVMAGEQDEGQSRESLRQANQGFAHGAGERVAAAKQGNQRQRRGDGDVLRQQDGKGAPSIGGLRIAALLQQVHGDGGGRKGQGYARRRRAEKTQVQEFFGGEADDRGGQDHLAEPDHANVAPHGAQPRRLERQADQKQQQHHAELGNVQGQARVGDKAEAGWTDRHAGGEIADHRSEAGNAKHGRENHRRAKKNQDRDEKARLGGQVGHGALGRSGWGGRTAPTFRLKP